MTSTRHDWSMHLAQGSGQYAAIATFQAAGIVWYRRKDFDAMSALFVSATKCPSYDDWLKDAEAAEQRCLSCGQIVVRAYLDIDTFFDWCARRGLSAGKFAREAFAINAIEEASRLACTSLPQSEKPHSIFPN